LATTSVLKANDGENKTNDDDDDDDEGNNKAVHARRRD